MGAGVALSVTAHPAFGRLVVVAAAGGAAARLTTQEALTLSRALAAVRAGRSAEREIYLSPIASDADVVGLVGPDGVLLRIGATEQALDWAAVGALSKALDEAAT